MAVAKRQRKENACENGTKENPRTRVRTSGEKTALLASPICKVQAGPAGRTEMNKRRKPRRTEASPLGSHVSRMYYPLLAK